MERKIDLKQISDGRFYTANDMVKAGCGGCAGCSLCCHGMGRSIILDPYDIFHLEKGLGVTFEGLMEEKIELNVVDGIIQPNLKMQEESDRCAFLDEKGRCMVHTFRPGFCRMFPLGRIYENGSFRYFLQVHECPYPNKTKVKLKKWLGIPELGRYESYVKDWHYFLKDAQKIIRQRQEEALNGGQDIPTAGAQNSRHANGDDNITKSLNMYLLKQFYVKAYSFSPEEDNGSQERPAHERPALHGPLMEGDGNSGGFYGQFYERLKEAKEVIKAYR